MAYPLDVAAQNAGLQSWFGDDHAASVPASWEVALFDAHPLSGGVELDSSGGYARIVAANTSANFPDPVDGQVVSATLAFADPTDAWSDTARWFVLIDHADSTTRWYVGQLLEEMSIVGTETGVAVQLAIYWNTEGA